MLLNKFKNMEKISFLIFIFFVHHAAGYFTLTDEQFAMMPPLIHVDRFSHCVNSPGGIYCTAHADIVSDKPHPILDMMVNYTNTAVRHYDYTKIIYGLCMTDRCKHHVKGNSTTELIQASEACLNETFNRKYNLGVRVENANCYKYKERKHKADYLDSIVGYVLGGIIALNVLATLYDVFFQKEDEESLLLSFSWRANWRRLVAPPTTDPRKSKLIGVNGMRAITTIMVMLGHSPLAGFMSVENPQWLEGALDNVLLRIAFHGHIIIMTFFVLSGFLLTYNIQILSETRKITWSMLPKGIFVRWLRLSPVNIAILVFTATLFRFTSYGPFWQENIGVEIDDCRKHWPSVLFYYNNYVDDSVCNLQNWSMACDMHFHIIGLAIVILSPTVKVRNRTMLVFFILGIVLSALEVYFRDLDGNLLVVPHALRNYLAIVPTFIYLYKRTHTNIPSFIVGMYLGYLIYDWQLHPISEKTRKRFGYAYWTLFFWALMVEASIFIFLEDGPRAPMWTRILFAMIQRPLFGILIAMVIAGLAIGVEDTPLYSWILESPIWTPLSKISYSMFATHVVIIRYLGGLRSTISYVSLLHTLHDYSGVVVIATILGFLLYMLVESPFGQLCKLLFISRPKSRKRKSTNENGTHTNGIHTNGNTTHVNGKTTHENGNSISINGKLKDSYNGKPVKAE